MYRNFYLFNRQISDLKRLLQNNPVKNCFTHRKDELVLHINNDVKAYFLRISVNKKFPYLLLYHPQNIKTHHTYFFEELNGCPILDISIVPFDKLVRIDFADIMLECTFYGNSPNIILRDTKGSYVDQFKKSSGNSAQNQSRHVLNPFSFSKDQLENLISQYSDLEVVQFIQKFIGGFNTVLSRELVFRSSLTQNTLLLSLKKTDIDVIINNIENMMHEMQHIPAHVYQRNDLPQYLAITRLTHLGNDYEVKQYKSVNEAWKYFINFYQITQRFNQIKLLSRNALHRKIGYLRRTLGNIRQSEDVDKKKKLAELKGNLLLTYVQNIAEGSDEVTLKNIFSPDSEKITIKLDPNKSVTENARFYFNKYKDINRTKTQMRIRKRTYEQELKEYQKLADDLSETTSMTELIRIQKKLSDRGIIQKKNDHKETRQERREHFKHAILDQNWEVFVGRNARNNDLLTFKFARKFDFWLHAQGVSGSHVILRRPQKDRQPPHTILVQAAQIAAYYSTAHTNTTVPVIYTEVRFVRKPRKSPPGLVTTIQSQTIFVTPKNLI